MKFCILLTSSHLENILKYVFEMGVNRKFDFRRIWKFCSGLINVISGGNWLFRWDCFFRLDFVLLCELWTYMTYVYSIYMYILSTFCLKKMKVAEVVSKYLPTKHAMKLRKFPHLCWLLKAVGGEGGGGNFYQKNKLKSEMLKCLTTKKVDNFFLCHY